MPQEHSTTVKARKKMIDIFNMLGYETEEEKIYECNNNMGFPIYPSYKADIYVKHEFNLELDPDEIHNNSKHNINHDQWKDQNIYNQHQQVKTVRLNPRMVNKQNLFEIMAEIQNQLREKIYNK